MARDEDMTRTCECHGGGMRGVVDGDCEHWAEGKHRLVARFPIEEVVSASL